MSGIPQRQHTISTPLWSQLAEDAGRRKLSASASVSWERCRESGGGSCSTPPRDVWRCSTQWMLSEQCTERSRPMGRRFSAKRQRREAHGGHADLRKGQLRQLRQMRRYPARRPTLAALGVRRAPRGVPHPTRSSAAPALPAAGGCVDPAPVAPARVDPALSARRLRTGEPQVLRPSNPPAAVERCANARAGEFDGRADAVWAAGCAAGADGGARGAAAAQRWIGTCWFNSRWVGWPCERRHGPAARRRRQGGRAAAARGRAPLGSELYAADAAARRAGHQCQSWCHQ
eukprot:SAG31_NODE_9055_length_1342_cov_1.494771_1_plen_288_part_00